jgi:2-keto-3-deoxy-L-fuconate dehydrogenase
MNKIDLNGRCAVVTGGAQGFGRAITERFIASGAKVAIWDHDQPFAEKTAKEIGGGVIALRVDVSDLAAVEKTRDATLAALGKIDILVNNAGIAHVGNALSTTEADLDRIYAVNVKGVALCTRAALGPMLAQRAGVILNLASIASLIGLEDRFAYSMSKGAVLAMTRSVAVDYMQRGIRCNCVCPARIHTPFVDGFIAKNYPGRESEMFKKLSEYQPIGRMGEPGEVAALALYLCSDEAAFITGQAFPIDGGVLVK